MGRTMRSRGISSYRSNKRSKRGNKLSKRISKRRVKRSNKRSNRRLNRKSFKRVSKRMRNNRKNYKGGTPPQSPYRKVKEKTDTLFELPSMSIPTDINYDVSKRVHPGDLITDKLYICVPKINERAGPMFAGEPKIMVPDNKSAFGIKFLGREDRDRLYNIMYMTGEKKGTTESNWDMGTTYYFFSYPYI